MNSNSRPILCYDFDPRLKWNKVSDADSYRFKLIDGASSQELWQIEITNAKSENKFCYCDYPQGKDLLEPLVSYQFIAEALSNEGCLSKFETEVILLGEKDRKACQEFEAAIENLEGMEELKQMWFVQMKSVLGNGGDEQPDIEIPLLSKSYIGVSFPQQNIS